MSIKKVLAVVIVLILASTMLFGCGQNGQNESVSKDSSAKDAVAKESSTNKTAIKDSSKEKFMLAFTSPALTSPAYSYMLAGLKDELAKNNSDIELKVNSPTAEADVGAQVSIVETFIQMKVNAIAISAMSNDAIGPVVLKANSANIPVFAFNTPEAWPQGNAATDIGYDQKEAGKVAGELIAKKLPDGGDIAILQGLPSPFNTSRIGGAKEVLAKYPKIKVAAEQSGKWAKDESYKVTQNILTANPNIKIIYAISDEMALGAKAAAKDAGKNVFVIGLDGTLDAFQSIKAGELDATIDTHLADEGRNIAKAALILQKGEKLQPKMYAQPSVVDKSNAEEVLNSLKTIVDKYIKK